MSEFSITQEDIESAHQRIDKFVHRTPVMTSEFFNSLADAHFFFKCENLQKTGSFKIRGATNAIRSLDPRQLKHGVATHSSGNHAQAVALAANKAGSKAFVVMPENSAQVKKEGVKTYGAKIIECAPTLKAREDTLRQLLRDTNAEFIPPFNDFRIIAGQATCAKEIYEEIAEVDYLFAPVGGGGLLSGSLLSSLYFSPRTKVIAAEPEGASDAFLSWKAGKIIPVETPKTIADGLRTSLGEKTFPIIHKLVHEIELVSDMEIVKTMRMVWERLKIVVEPSGVVSLAAALKVKEKLKNKKVAIIFSGGNCDLSALPF